MAQPLPPTKLQATVCRFISAALLCAIALLLGITNTRADALCCDAADAMCIPQTYSDDRVALVFGNNAYGGQLSSLTNAVNDARAMATTLKERYSVRCILNADRTRFDTELTLFRKHLDQVAEEHEHDFIEGRALLYFAGHGFAVENENLIVLGGPVANRDDLEDGRTRKISGIAAELGSHTNFKTYLIFDSCRNFVGGTMIKPDWAGTGFVTPRTFEEINIVFTTGPGSFARDEIDESTPKGNGAYMYTVGRYAAFRGLNTPLLLAGVIGKDPAMRSLHQNPVAMPTDLLDSLPWTGDTSDCAVQEALVVAAIANCRPTGDPKTCMRLNMCRPLNAMAVTSPVCPNLKLSGLFSAELQACADAAPTATLRDVLGVVQVAGVAPDEPTRLNAAASAVILQAQAQRKQLTAAWQATLASQIRAAEEIIVLPGNRTATRSQSSGIQQQINRQVFTGGTGVTSFASGRIDIGKITNALVGTTPLNSTEQRPEVELKVLPTDKSGTTGRLKIDGPVVADCALLPCTDNFSMTRVNTDKGPVFGWIESEKLTPVPPRCSASIDYQAETDFQPTLTSLKRLSEIFIKDCAQNILNASIIVSLPVNANTDALSLANKRAALIKGILSLTSVPFEAIETSFVEGANAGAATPLTVLVR